MKLIGYLPDFYAASPQIAALQGALEQQTEALWTAENGLIDQLDVNKATWGLSCWEASLGLDVDVSRPDAYRRTRILSKLRGQGATTAEMIASVVASFGFQPEQVSVTEHPADYQFEVVVSDLAAVPEDTADIQAAVNEIKPAHLDWWFTWVMAQLLETVGIGSGLWRIRETAIPPMEE